MDKERKKQYYKEWELKNKEKRKDYKKEYRLKNKENIKEYNKAYSSKPENKDHKKELSSRPEAKKRRKELNSRPENKKQQMEYAKEYRLKNKEKNKEYRNEYESRPKVKKHRKKYLKEYRSIPENKEHKKEWANNNPQIHLKANIKHLKKYAIPFKLTHLQYKYALMALSKTVRKLHDNKCQICFEPAIHCHHIFHKKFNPGLSLNINNGISLCKLHHDEVHGKNLNIFSKKRISFIPV